MNLLKTVVLAYYLSTSFSCKAHTSKYFFLHMYEKNKNKDSKYFLNLIKNSNIKK